LLPQSGCISSALLGTGCGDVSLTVSANSKMTIANPCIAGGAWTAHDQFEVVDLAALAGISVTRNVDSHGIVTRQLVIGPTLPSANSPVDLGYVYQFENGEFSQGVLHAKILAALSAAAATPSQIVSGQSTQLNAIVTGGSPPYSYYVVAPRY